MESAAERANPDSFSNAQLIIDALFGAGLDREIEGEARALIDAINAHPASVISVDLPSGINGSTGAVMGVAVTAAELSRSPSQARAFVAAGPVARPHHARRHRNSGERLDTISRRRSPTCPRWQDIFRSARAAKTLRIMPWCFRATEHGAARLAARAALGQGGSRDPGDAARGACSQRGCQPSVMLRPLR